ncbi:MAG TPA: HEAT repeat domain-containing protein [Myxococcaceae bacterium]|nr:HEAT repeat domain-containing protein [Myxococcaceae bacterium]
MSDGRAEALLRSALEKIVYFEARSETLQADAATLRAEVDALRADLASAAHREVELRRRVAELEVELGRAHRDREEGARVLDAMRAERAGLMGKVLEASRIQGNGTGLDFDLAGFISDLRAEAIALRAPALEAAPARRLDGPSAPSGALDPVRAEALETVAVHSEAARNGPSAPAAAPVPGGPARPAPAPRVSTPPGSPSVSSAATLLAVTREAERLFEQGRLAVPPSPRLGEESLFGFSIRELSSPDPSARSRAAERLRTLGDRAASPALAVALHAERDDTVLVALLEAFRALASREGAAVVQPLLNAPEPVVRIAALRAITHLDPESAPAHLSHAAHDADASVRRRTTLLAVSLGPERMLELERQVSRDPDPEVRRLAVLAAGAAGGEQARSRLLGALEDPDLGVRRAAARSLSGLLGMDVGHIATLSDEERRREVRQLATVPPVPLAQRAKPLGQPTRSPPRIEPEAEPRELALGFEMPAEIEDPAPSSRTGPDPIQVTLPPGPAARDHGAAGLHADEALCLQITSELRTSMRGRTVLDLATQLGVTDERVIEAAALLTARGQVVRRGAKLFVA